MDSMCMSLVKLQGRLKWSEHKNEGPGRAEEGLRRVFCVFGKEEAAYGLFPSQDVEGSGFGVMAA